MIGNNGNLTKAGAMLADKILIYQNRLFCTRWNGLTKAGGNKIKCIVFFIT